MERKKYFNYGTPRPDGGQRLEVFDEPARLTPPPEATHMLLYVEGQPVRWRAGYEPTDTAGILLFPGDYIDWMGSDLDYQEIMADLYFVKDASAGAGAAILQVQYFK